MSLTIEIELKDIFSKIDRHLERIEQSQNDLNVQIQADSNKQFLNVENSIL
jgi:hypothetical protein